jgi:hypothetical protein
MPAPTPRPRPEPADPSELNELIAALVAEIEWLRRELEYMRLQSELASAQAEMGTLAGVVEAVKADPDLSEADRYRLITLYRDLLRGRAMQERDRERDQDRRRRGRS